MRLVIDLATKDESRLLEMLNSLEFVDSVSVVQKDEDEAWVEISEKAFSTIWESPENDHWDEFLEQIPEKE